MHADAQTLARQVEKVAHDIALGMDSYKAAPKGGLIRSALMAALTSKLVSLKFAVDSLDRVHCLDVKEDLQRWRASRPPDESPSYRTAMIDSGRGHLLR